MVSLPSSVVSHWQIIGANIFRTVHPLADTRGEGWGLVSLLVGGMCGVLCCGLLQTSLSPLSGSTIMTDGHNDIPCCNNTLLLLLIPNSYIFFIGSVHSDEIIDQ